MKNLTPLTALFLSTAFSPILCQAGGSITRDEARTEVCAQSPRICRILQTFTLSETGSAARAGRHLPNGGERVMPYEFEAVTADEKVLLTIDRDENGGIFLTLKPI